MTVFVALADVIDNPDARAALERTFSTVVVASAREHAVTEMTALGDTVDAAIIGVRERIDADVLVALPRLRVVGSLGAGTDHLDLVALADRGVRVITTPGVNAVSVAEHALMMILALAKRTLPAHAAVLGGQDRAGMIDPPIEVRGRRVGVLGAGATARALIPLLRALGMDVMVWTRRADRHPDLPTAGLEEIFGGCSIVSVHLPLTPQTCGLVGAQLLRRLPPSALVVNVARKEIIDSGGLRTVVAERPDLRFAVDDFGLADDGTVAVVGDRGLWSPHVAGITVEASAAMDDVVVRGVVQAVSGQY
jgi:D-3-phosphoglycerate dehydrogenase